MRRAPSIFLLLLLLGGAAQAQREQDTLMEVEEDQKTHVLPQNILRKEEKRIDAINLRKNGSWVSSQGGIRGRKWTVASAGAVGELYRASLYGRRKLGD